MMIKLSDYRNDQISDMTDSSIELRSTSFSTADASPIVLCQSDLIRLKFIPQMVENEKDSVKAISGKLIYEKKKKADILFPSETEEGDKLSRRSIKTGDWMEISLNTSETYNLFQGLKQLYGLAETIGSIPMGTATYTRDDRRYRDFLSILQNDPDAAKMIGSPKNYELVKILLQLITSSDSLESLKNNLSSLNENSIKNLSESINTEQLIRAKQIIFDNLNNDNEEFWQSNILAKHQWILGQIFSAPCTIYQEKAYVGGKGISNTGGNICDFIYKNDLSKNVVLIEIKTPCTKIAGAQYRGTYTFTGEFSGAINQVLAYKDKLTKSYYALAQDNNFEVFNPKCVVVIGKLSDLNSAQKAAFENYRNSLSNIIIITFDELLERVSNLLAILSEDDKRKAERITPKEKEFPF